MLMPRMNHQNSPVRSTITDTHFLGFGFALVWYGLQAVM